MDKVYNLYLEAAGTALPQFATAELAEKMSVLAAELSGAKMNLTAIRRPEAVVWLHFIDSLYAADILRGYVRDLPGNTLADVGSGGGFPALPVAAAIPELNVCAIDSTAKKCDYIKHTAEIMGLENLNVMSVRAEDYGRTAGRDAYAAVCARAVAELDILLELCLPLVSVGGVFLAMRGTISDDELICGSKAAAILGAIPEKTVKYTLPGYADDRNILVYRKRSATPDEYPRAFAKITKSPL